VALEAQSRVYPAVYHVLVEIVAAVGQKAFRRILIFVARLDLFLVRVAVAAERFPVTEIAGLLSLGRKYPVRSAEIRGMFHGRVLISMTLAASGFFDSDRMYFSHAPAARAIINNR